MAEELKKGGASKQQQVRRASCGRHSLPASLTGMARGAAATAACFMAAMAMILQATAGGAAAGGGGEGEALVVTGRVYCDACGAGVYGRSSFYLAGAKVGVQCKSRAAGGNELLHVGVTDAHGVFRIPMMEEEVECVAMVLRSAHPSCNILKSQRSFAQVFLTRNAGLADNLIRTGPFSFQPARLAPPAACATAQLAASLPNNNRD